MGGLRYRLGIIMKNIIIYGAGGFGREVYCWLRDYQSLLSDINFVGFLDDGYDLGNIPVLRELYLGKGLDWVIKDNEYFIVAIGQVQPKKCIVDYLRRSGANFFNFIHPSALIGERVNIGNGNIICPGCIFTTDISIGDHNLFNMYSTIGHDVIIGSNNIFSAHNDITGHVTIGNDNFFGSRVSVLPGKAVGDNNKVSAGSVLFRSIKNDLLVMGNPAKTYK
jgi:sugar O-acyltransferase (sialic acid O-acetyltransferase NeuD family)